MRNREEAKERFANLIRITPEIPLDITDIYLYPNRALLNLNLEPLTQYTIEIASYDVGF
ncbi:MAG: hypothetical protein LBF15_04260 [Candidatus Peribacteria bacterium]|nr:hypothetical protein [Candidatus Peribacteria bacterium]